MAGYSPWDHTESDTTEQLSAAQYRSPLAESSMLSVFVWPVSKDEIVYF